MHRQGWSYKGQVRPVEVGHVWVVVTMVVAAGVAAVAIGLVLPHDPPLDWAVVLGAVATLALLAGTLAVLGRAARVAGGTIAPPPMVAFGLALAFLLALAPIAAQLSGPSGSFLPLLLLPSIVVASFGAARMVVVFGAATVAAVAVAARSQGVEPSTVLAITAAYGCVWGAVLTVFHRIQLATAHDINRHRDLARLVSSIPTATDLPDALEVMLPIIAGLLGARTIDVRIVGKDRSWGEARPVARWRAPDGPVTVTEWPADLAPATAVDRERAVVAVRAPEPGGHLVLATHTKPVPLGEALAHAEVAEQTRAALELLTERLRLLHDLEARSRTDQLTGLANRYVLHERLRLETDAARRDPGRALTLAMVDLDHFKAINDEYGHPVGDEVLVEFAGLLTARLRGTDLAARYGGEEFCLVLPGTDADGATDVTEQIRHACRELRTPRPVTFSAGIAQWDGTEAPLDLIARADLALYRSKVEGRDRTSTAPGPHRP